MTNQQQVDLLKQESATLWNTRKCMLHVSCSAKPVGF
jgi:hypothetical protein